MCADWKHSCASVDPRIRRCSRKSLHRGIRSHMADLRRVSHNASHRIPHRVHAILDILPRTETEAGHRIRDRDTEHGYGSDDYCNHIPGCIRSELLFAIRHLVHHVSGKARRNRRRIYRHAHELSPYLHIHPEVDSPSKPSTKFRNLVDACW
jgi:hypothetical protein